MNNIKKCLSFVVLLISIISISISANAEPRLNKKSMVIYVGDKGRLKVTGYSGTVTWKSSNSQIATVSDKGVVTGNKMGSCSITAEVKMKKIKCTVTVKPVSVSRKYLENKTWRTFGNNPWPPKIFFDGKYCITYSSTGKYLGKTRYSVIKTTYGYYIKLKGGGGYRLYLKGSNANKKVLSCIGDGNPYSIDGYSGSSSLFYGSIN